MQSFMGEVKVSEMQILYLKAFYRSHVSDQFSLEKLNNLLNKLTSYTNNPIIWLSGNFNSPDI